MLALRFLVSNFFPRAWVWPLWIIPSCHSPHWTALGFVFHFNSAKELVLGSTFPVFVSAQMQVTIQHPPDPSRDTEVCCPLVGKGIMVVMELTNQLLTPASKTLCNLPSPSLGELLCPVPSNSPISWVASSWWPLRTTGSCLFGEICLYWDDPSCRAPSSLVLFFFITISLEPNSRYILYDFFVLQFRPSDFFSILTHTLHLWFWPWLNCHFMIVPGMGTSSYRLAYKVLQGRWFHRLLFCHCTSLRKYDCAGVYVCMWVHTHTHAHTYVPLHELFNLIYTSSVAR